MDNKPAENKGQAGQKNMVGLYIIGAALVVLVLGYFVLSKVNADASN